MQRVDSPGPPERRGPRPLLLHLNLAFLRSAASLAAAGERSEHGDALAREAEQALRHDQDFVEGVSAYRRHAWRRTLADPPTVWREGETRLLDYGGLGTDQGTEVSVLFVPSLVNRAYVLDLAPGYSMMRWLARQRMDGLGIRPLLLDWGWPGEAECEFTFTDYVAGRLERALTQAAARGPVVLAGYCMGGLLAVAAALRRPDLVRALALLATPWEFHAPDPQTAKAAAATLPSLEPALSLEGSLAVDAIQTLFAMLDPTGVADKYRSFARLEQDSERARLFVAFEDWVNDGVPLAAPVARECLAGWYGENTPARGLWRIADQTVDPTRLRLPTFVAAPSRDRIVPPQSSRPLASLIPEAVLHEPDAGHVGMAAGRSAEQALWKPLLEWLNQLSLRH